MNHYRRQPRGSTPQHAVRKTADAIRCGGTMRREEMKAQPKKMQNQDSSDDDKEAVAKEGGEKKNNARRWFVGCYGCGKHYRWLASSRGLAGRVPKMHSMWKSGLCRQGVRRRHGNMGRLHQQVGTAVGIQAELAKAGAQARAQAQPQPQPQPQAPRGSVLGRESIVQEAETRQESCASGLQIKTRRTGKPGKRAATRTESIAERRAGIGAETVTRATRRAGAGAATRQSSATNDPSPTAKMMDTDTPRSLMPPWRDTAPNTPKPPIGDMSWAGQAYTLPH